MVKPNEFPPKITLLAETCWVIRWTKHDGEKRYFESHQIWNKSPAHATIFRSEAAGDQEVWRAKSSHGLVDSSEILEVVPLHGALLTGGTKIEIKRS